VLLLISVKTQANHILLQEGNAGEWGRAACRVGLLPRINRPRRHVTHTKPAPVQAPPPPAPRLRVLRPRSPLFECDSETESDLDSPTSSGALRVRAASPQLPRRLLWLPPLGAP
jgi:hypothetical protein